MPTFGFRSKNNDKKSSADNDGGGGDGKSTPTKSPMFRPKAALSSLKSTGQNKLNEAASKGKDKLAMGKNRLPFAGKKSETETDNSKEGTTYGDEQRSVVSSDSMQLGDVMDQNSDAPDDDDYNDDHYNSQEEEYDEGDTSEIFVADRRGYWHSNSDSGMGKRFGSESRLHNSLHASVSSDQSEADAFFIQGGVRQNHLVDKGNSVFATTSSGRVAPRIGAVSLEAHMSLKYSKATGFPTKWFKAYVILDMDTVHRGSIKIYSDKPKASKIQESLHESTSPQRKQPKRKISKNVHQSTRIGSTDLHFLDQSVKPLLEIPTEMNWVAKDYERSGRRFVIEIPSESATMVRSSILYAKMKDNKVNTTMDSEMFNSDSFSSEALKKEDSNKKLDARDSSNKSAGKMSDTSDADDDKVTPLNDPQSNSLLGALKTARRKKEPFRLHFQCLRKGGNEKQVWMTAFEELGRLSFDLHKRVFGFGKKMKDQRKSNERVRVKRNDKFAKQAQKLSTLGKRESEMDDSMQGSSGVLLDASANTDRDASMRMTDDEASFSSDDEFSHVAHKLKPNFQLTHKSDTREFMVYPYYAYPNKWMTHSEIYNEMLKPSLVYHDLRTHKETKKEIGTVRVEVLECTGLPKMDWNTETDAVVYLVCGSYAFTTDVITDKLNPVWLPRSRRACIFPLFHAYANVFAGVFDDDGPAQKDDFAGRVVLDLAKCRPGSTYDVALPLRLSTQVYSRRPRGAIRLRFSIDYTSHQAAILSYLPDGKFNDPDKESNSVSVLCYDEKSFRNISLTVHGDDLPGKFNTDLMKATTREINFLRKVCQKAVEDTILDIIFWKNRPFSALCFLAWMHCCYLNSFGLVPFYFLSFWLLMMMQNYAFYGSNGRVQQGFVPPSFEEMAMALLKGKPIEPLYVRPHRDEASALKSEKTVKTHDEKLKKLLNLLGFKSSTEEDQPEDYHMEFPLSRSIRHPITEDYLYPRFSIKDCKVVKNTQAKKDEDDDRSYSMDILAAVSSIQDPQQLGSRLGVAAGNLQAKALDTLEKGRQMGKERLKDTKHMLETKNMGNLLTSVAQGHVKVDADQELAAAFQRLPKILQIQDQNIDVPEISESGEKKKIVQELYDVRDELHELTRFAFLDKTHKIVQKDPMYFGGKQTKYCEHELDKLLALGTHATPNPVKSVIAVHMVPLISAIHGFLHGFRCAVNVATWHDPILSFWVTLALFIAAMVSLIFPFRLFFAFVGAVLLGPQNYVFIKHVRPNFREELSAKRKVKRMIKLEAAKKGKVYRDIPTNQPIITSHTSDNSPPLNLSLNQVDKRGIHQVCVPYSQLTYRRDNYWPPQPEYGRCDPHVRGFQRSMNRMKELSQRKSTIGVPRQRLEKFKTI